MDVVQEPSDDRGMFSAFKRHRGEHLTSLLRLTGRTKQACLQGDQQLEFYTELMAVTWRPSATGSYGPDSCLLLVFVPDAVGACNGERNLPPLGAVRARLLAAGGGCRLGCRGASVSAPIRAPSRRSSATVQPACAANCCSYGDQSPSPSTRYRRRISASPSARDTPVPAGRRPTAGACGHPGRPTPAYAGAARSPSPCGLRGRLEQVGR